MYYNHMTWLLLQSLSPTAVPAKAVLALNMHEYNKHALQREGAFPEHVKGICSL